MKFLLLSFMIVPLLLAAQDKNRVFGRAVQKTNGAPIPNASVFINGSALGTTTDTAGNFVLSGIMPGDYQLVVSSVGFNTRVFYVSSAQLPLQLDVQMEPKVEELNAVTVEPFDPDGLNKYGHIFLEHFIGTTPAAKQCRITNMNALRFRYNRKERELTVVSDEPLIIENDYLGYTLKYQLEDFTYSYNTGVLFYYGYPFFIDKTDQLKRRPPRTGQRRAASYNGSMSHFMYAIYHDRLAEEGFEARSLALEPNYEKERVKKIMAAQSRNNIRSGGVTVMRLGLEPHKDSVAYYRKVMQQPDQLQIIGEGLQTADSVLSRPAEDSTRRLIFSNYLQITYKKKREEEAYLVHTGQKRKPRHPVSLITHLNENGIAIHPNGYFHPPHMIFTREYWAWSEKIASLLPIGYSPGGKE